jgi:hypothetical protein
MTNPSHSDRWLRGVTFSIAALLTVPSAVWSTIAMPITPYDTLIYLLIPSLAAVMTIRWARRTPRWSWPVLVTHQIVLSALYFTLYLGLWVLIFMAAWGGGYALIALMLGPLPFLVGRYSRARSLARAEPTSSRRAMRAGLGAACLAYAGYAGYQIRAILQSQGNDEYLTIIGSFLLIAPIVLLGSFAIGWVFNRLGIYLRSRGTVSCV